MHGTWWDSFARARGGSSAATSLGFFLISLLAVAPCFWQSRIQAGDLSSHIYNAWLVSYIRAIHPPGLEVVSSTTNVLFDEMLSLLMAHLGAGMAQRVASAAAVLVFFWGAFRFAGRFAHGRPWQATPFLLIFAYGWTFQMGLLNFYLSLGLCFWALSWALDFRPRAALPALALAAFAWRAHSLPVLWSAGALVWAYARLKLPRRDLLRLGVAFGVVVALLSAWLRLRYQTQWSVEQLSSVTGADQAWIFDFKYYVVFAGILFFWVTQAAERMKTERYMGMLEQLPVQLALLTAFSIGVLPTGILLPGYSHGLVFIAERMSLAISVCLVAWMAGALMTRGRMTVAMALAMLYFGMIYRDWAGLNRLEDRVDQAVATAPGDARVISAFKISGSRIPAAAHMVDRACLGGQCFSYSNYEASTGQFRVRATAPNPVVVSEYAVAYAMQTGDYTARLQDGPVFEVLLGPSTGRLGLLPMGGRQTVFVVTPF